MARGSTNNGEVINQPDAARTRNFGGRMRILLGIDPGLSGAVVALCDYGVSFYDAPTIEVAKGKGKKREYDVAAMRAILCEHDLTKCFAVLERSQAFPDQGAVSNFTTGHGYGLWRGLLVGLGIAYETVHPRTWKGAMGLDGDKAKSFLLAKQLFPGVADQFKKPKGRVDSLDGRAEALLLCEWARRKNESGMQLSKGGA